MIKKLISAVAALLTIFSIISVLLYLQLEEQKYPFYTKDSLSMSITETQENKLEIIESLNKVVDKHNAVFIKTTANIKDFEHKKDIIWFGNNQPILKSPMVRDSEIYWLGGKLSGEVFSSNEMGERILSGDYSYSANEDFIVDLEKWAKDHSIQLKMQHRDSIFEIIYSLFFFNGFGNGILTSFIFLVTVFLLWFVEHAKARSIRLLGGISPRKIHLDDVREIVKSVAVGEVIGGIFGILYLFYKQGVILTSVLWIPFAICFFIILIGAVLISFVISVFASPKAKHIAQRKILFGKFNQLSRINRLIAILIAFIVLPITLQGLILTKNLLEEHKIWNKNNAMVRIAFRDYDAVVSQELSAETEKFFRDAYDNGIMSVSYVLDRGIALEAEILGEYDHIVITDRTWVDSIDVGVDTIKENGKLTKLEYSKLNVLLKNFLDHQLAIMTNSGEVIPKGMRICRFQGQAFVALPPGVGMGEETIQAKNPLVILVDNPVEVFKVDGFLLNASSTGNVVFKDADRLKKILGKTKISSFVSSIDNIAEQSLEMAQQFSSQMAAYITSSIVVFASIIMMGGLNAEIWAIQNKKRIFILHTFGMSFGKIIKTPMKNEIALIVLTAAFGLMITYFFHHAEFKIIISVVFFVILMQILSEILIYRHYSKKEFTKAVCRN